ncbi:hypothetical protein ACTXT7_002393 [Hymenolepis weldensis]
MSDAHTDRISELIVVWSLKWAIELMKGGTHNRTGYQYIALLPLRDGCIFAKENAGGDVTRSSPWPRFLSHIILITNYQKRTL